MNCKNQICQADRDTMHAANEELRAENERLTIKVLDQRAGFNGIAFRCMEAGHWQMKEQEPYICFACHMEAMEVTKLQISDLRKAIEKAIDSCFCDDGQDVPGDRSKWCQRCKDLYAAWEPAFKKEMGMKGVTE